MNQHFKHTRLLIMNIKAWLVILLLMSSTANASHPHLVNTAADVLAMRSAIKHPGLFQSAYLKKKAQLDQQMLLPMDVPVPKDAGGGYTHERHKKNAKLMYDAGIIFQLTQDKKYADFVKKMLFKYAVLYPTLPLHPLRKGSSPGKLFWQGLNEAVWLVYTIQAYDDIIPSLTKAERNKIEQGIIRPVALFLSVQSPATFNKVHNHGTWYTAAVGMTGYVLGEHEWVEKALYDLKKSGKGGFIKQLNQLFSPQGYYNEGPYYQRYALMPFVTFAKAIDVNEPQRKIFDLRNGVILKAIRTTIELSYNQLFFPINDSIKDKGIDTIELVNGVALAYGITGDNHLLDIAKQQHHILLTGDGLKVAQAIEANKAQKYVFKSRVFGDGHDGKHGALVVMRQQDPDKEALVFKATSQGLGHGHFDKLTWQLYDKGEEIVADYGAARFLNVEAKYGGRYLPENKSWAQQTIAHNTLVVDQTSHFNGITSVGNKYYPTLNFFKQTKQLQIVSAEIGSAYKDVKFSRTMALFATGPLKGMVVDMLKVSSKNKHQYDLPMHYHGQLIDTNFKLNTNTKTMSALGQKNGYQHLWLKASSKGNKQLNQVTWLNKNGKFYTQTSTGSDNQTWLFTELGADDPNFNLRRQSSFIQRIDHADNYTFTNIIEPHGEYNPSKEYTVSAVSSIKALHHTRIKDIDIIDITANNQRVILAISQNQSKNILHKISYQGIPIEFSGHFKLFEHNK